eukprot:XP_001698087.1 predicted protein [Chlamydomonas reinhardtii]
MRQQVCIPSGCQQWVSRTVTVGVDRFAYMSSLAIYVYSSFMPLAILAKHEKHLSALALSPFHSHLLAAAIGTNHEMRLYDIDTELPVCSTSYSAPKANVHIITWHRTQEGVLLLAAGSHLVAWGRQYEMRSISLPDGVPATSVAWEPLSTNGLLLVVGRGGALALYDSGTGETVLQYAKQPATAFRCAQFVASQPGNFLLSSSRSGALQLWNVSQPQPLRLLKPAGGLVQGFALLPAPSAGASGARAGAGAGGAGKRTAVLVSFADGGVCVYDLASQTTLWRQEGGHTETIFDCRFCTTDPNLLATASFDSSVRVWDVRTARCIKLLGGAEGILYSVSWSADGKLLAASNDSGMIYIYDYARGMLIKGLRQHTKQSLKVAFHPVKPTLLASSSVDGTVYVYTVDGETVRTLRHFSPVSCIAWGVLCPELVATTTDHGELHVWDTSRPAADCLQRTLEAHTARTFNVEFSPLVKHWLLSSSNDRTARVWDVSTGDCQTVLQGHTAEVRAVAWHPEVAHICFTGSWDSAVRVWDARNGRCLRVANDHHADVYGIACHPARPFFIVTCSRDTTLRLWSTLDLTPHLFPQALLLPLPKLRCTAEEAVKAPESAPALLSGAASRELAERLAGSAVGPLERFAALADFFMPPACQDAFWELARASHVSDVLPLYLVSGAVPALVDVLSASQLYDTAFNVAATAAAPAPRPYTRRHDPLTTNRVFAALGLQEHAVYSAPAATAAAGASAASGSWDGFRALLLGGAAEAAAEWALKAAGKLVDGGRRPSLTSPEWEQAWAAVNSLAPSALGRSMWLEVFGLALYAGAMAALEQGSAAVGLYLVRVLEAWAASTPGACLPVSQARLAAEVSEGLDACLGLPGVCGGCSGAEVREVLSELLAAPQGSQWMQGMLQARLAAAEARMAGGGGATPPMSPPFVAGRSSQSTGGGADDGPGGPSLVALAGSSILMTLADLARGPVVVAAAHVPSRSTGTASGALPVSVVSGGAIRGPAVALDGESVGSDESGSGGRSSAFVSLSEAVALRRVLTYSPLFSGKLLRLP